MQLQVHPPPHPTGETVTHRDLPWRPCKFTYLPQLHYWMLCFVLCSLAWVYITNIDHKGSFSGVYIITALIWVQVRFLLILLTGWTRSLSVWRLRTLVRPPGFSPTLTLEPSLGHESLSWFIFRFRVLYFHIQKFAMCFHITQTVSAQHPYRGSLG